MAETAARHLAPISISDGTSLSDLFEPYFGRPSGPIVTDPYRKQANQNYALPDAYRGRSHYLGEVINLQVSLADSFYTQILLPIKEVDELAISWNVWTFDQHQLDVVPEESMSRLVTSKMESQSASFVRRGLAFQLEHGFMKTARGIENYKYNLKQIAVAVSETNNFDVMFALLNADVYEKKWEREHGHYSQRRLDDRLFAEVNNWAIAQKDEHGFSKLDTAVTESMLRYHGRADTWILPPVMAAYDKFKPYNVDYYRSGKPWNVDSVDGYLEHGRNRIYLMRQYDVDKELVDMSLRERQIGSYNTMFDRNKEERVGSEYVTAERSILRFDEDRDDWVKLTLNDLLANCQLWDENGDLLDAQRPVGFVSLAFDQDVKRDFLLMKDASGASSTGRVPIQVIGHLKEKHLSTAAVMEMARCLLREVAAVGDEKKALEAAVQALFESKHNVVTVAEITDAVNSAGALKAFTSADKQLIAGLPVPGNGYYPLKDAADAAVKALALKVPTIAPDTMASIRSVLAKLRTILPNAAFIDGRFSGVKDGAADHPAFVSRVFMENLVGIDGLPVWVRENASTSGESLIADLDRTSYTQIAAIEGLLMALVTEKEKADLKGGIFEKIAALFFYKKTNDDEEIKKLPIHAIYLGTAENPDDSAKLAGQTERAFVYRTQLVAIITQFVIRAAAQGLSVAGISKILGEIKTFVNGKTIQNTSQEAIKSLIPDLVKVLAKTDFAQFVTTQMLESATALVNQAAITTISPTVGAQVPADTVVAKAFYITPITLNKYQAIALLDEIIGADKKDDQVGLLTVTLSNPLRLNQPLRTMSELKRVREAFQLELEGKSASNNPDALKSLPLIKLLRSLRDSGMKRSAIMQTGFPTAKRARTSAYAPAVYDDDDDAMNIDEQPDAYGRRVFSEDDEMRTWFAKIFPDPSVLPDLGNKRFATRMVEIDRMVGSATEKLVAKILISAPFNRRVLQQFILHNVPFPMAGLVVAPHMRYAMHYGIKMLAGSDTGNTYTGHNDFIVQDDARYKMHMGHYTLYSKAVVREPKNVYVAFDIFSARCLGGAGSVPVNRDEYDPRGGKYGNGSIMYLAVPYETQVLRNPLDVSGHFSYFTELANNDRDNDVEPHYSTAARYNAMYGFRRADEEGKVPVDHLYHPHIYDSARQSTGHNTVCFHDEERYFNTVTRSHSIRHTGTGHWGPFTFPGCKKLRNGAIAFWQSPAAPVS